MGRPERMEHYRDERDYGNLLDDEHYGEEDAEKEDLAEPAQQREEENYSQECQEYYERRERLKERERQRFRRSNGNGKAVSKSTSKNLPYDNYGNFFGPSQPVVTKRIIADIRARETASKVAARQSQEVSEPHRVSKGSSGMVSESRVVEMARPLNNINEQAIKLQRLKEARDYSFLFTDEDPAASPPRHEVRPSTKERQDDNRTKQPPSTKNNSGVSQRGTNSAKPVVSNSSKASMGSKGVVSKAQERHPTPTAKSSKPPERPPVSKSKVLPQSGSTSHPSKTTSGPGRPPQAQQARPNVSRPGLPDGKKPLPSSVTAQLKSLVASGPKGAGKLSSSSTSAKPAPGKGPPLKSTPLGSMEKKLPQHSGSKSQASTSRPVQKPPGGAAAVGRGVSTGRHDQRRPAQTASSSKMNMKPPQKRSWESESEDSFIDDDDEGGDFRSVIRKMFHYNPNKFRDVDDADDRLMEVGFRTIQMEEKRSARIAREEDERELALIEEEERRERERAKKKRKQQR